MDRVWKAFGVTGEGTLSIIHDFTFLFSGNVVGMTILFGNSMTMQAYASGGIWSVT